MDEFKKEKEILNGISASEKLVERKCDWHSGEEISLMRREQREKERGLLLDSVVPSRVCPSCKRRIWLDSCWVIKSKLAICRSCFHSRGKHIDDGRIVGGFIERVVIRVEINGWKIKTLRGKVGVGIQSFADRMGWTRSYQQQLESGKMKTIGKDAVENLINVFEEIGVDIVDIV